jgi:6-phosphogluconate dehydrogenase (decarboxylating)
MKDTSKMQLGMVGLGRMGASMARRLIKSAINVCSMTARRRR